MTATAPDHTLVRPMNGPELRRSERYVTRIEVRITRGDETLVGQTVNVSLGGVLLNVVLEPAAKIGERWQVEMTLPTLPDPLRATAEVRWIGLGGECGVQFTTGFRAKETWAFGQWIDQLRRAAV